MKQSFAVPTLLALAYGAAAVWTEAQQGEIKYTSVAGYFLQDDPKTNPDGFDYAASNFGLINRTYPTDQVFDPHGTKTQWQRFAQWVQHLNDDSRSHGKSNYKLFFLGRHGQGYHNVAEGYYGTPAWNCYWAHQTGNGTSTWEDAALTSNGLAEAYKANAYYRSRLENEGMPYFESYYSSPLKRCIETADATFATLDLPTTHAFTPIIKELFREGITSHTCNRRSTKTEIQGFAPPYFTFEHGFTEKDELWRGDKGESETEKHELARSKQAIGDVFANDDATWISVSSHSGAIRRLLEVLGHRTFSLSTGQIIPVLVRAEVVDTPEPVTTQSGFTPEATCESTPVTSISGQGCVCSDVILTTTTTTAAATTTEPSAVKTGSSL